MRQNRADIEVESNRGAMFAVRRSREQLSSSQNHATSRMVRVYALLVSRRQ